MQGEKEDAPVTVDKDADPVTMAEAFGPWMEVAFKQGDFIRKLKENRPEGNYGHRAEGNKGKEIVGHNRFIGLKDKASGLVHLEVEQGKPGQGHGLDNKKVSGRSGRVLNKTIRGRGRRFKIARNSRVSLIDDMNSMAKLIGEQVETLTDMVSTNEKGDKASIGL
ncbi:hypothetical protein PVK06_048208 [Gossypium arboreum]|uniref:Uncharacterized protein n=1 Tax=Gossypium arboreum TaxID=29729 RepID=A0ABR0MFT0_GOSAR|nr:hypothetical protein PVK06_048208 [Gossypium arboreum]